MQQRPARERAGGPLVLATKLHVPAARARVPRSALVERLLLGSLPGLTLVAAPPGWGKTTLLAAWCADAEADGSFAWLSLDTSDNDPVRFWTYVVEALRTSEPEAGALALALLRAPGASLVDDVVPALVNDLEQGDSPLALVLDDYHLIGNQEIHEALAFLVEHRPARLRLVLATRADPPLPLPRLRARGELLEIRAEELRFSAEETEAFLNGVLDLRLEPEDVRLLHERTEGWAAGLYLAALSLRGRGDAHPFIEAFAGDDRHVVDYLVTEVLERQPPDLRSFLVRTSILERLSAPLCDAVLAEDGSAASLARLERENLFLVPLDARRQWYRYHHLFADLLRHELGESEPDLVPVLHRRASAWFREDGAVSAAIRHAGAAGDFTTAAELVAAHWNEYLNQGRLTTVADWLAGLPEEVIAEDPRLCLARAGTSLTLGRRDEVEVWLAAAQAGTLPPGAATRAASIEAEASIYRAVHGFMLGDLHRARSAADRALELELDESSPWRAMAHAALGRTLFWLGEPDGAVPALEEAVRLYQPASNNLAVIAALGYLAILRADRGEAEETERLARRSLALSVEHGFTEHWVTLMALVALGLMRERAGRADDARAALERALVLARRGAGPSERAYVLLSLARVLRALDDADGAAALVHEAREAVERCVEPGILAGLLADADRRLRPEARRVAAAGEELTRRELAILRLLSSDRTLREIGATLYVSHNTVKTHVRGIYRKLHASTRGEAVARARELGLV
ncbi:MAG TPA: LuxR C-terminal-related transcriptional regulator [Gaiellaceae bacterium]|nr:LuxR C-terminal-related transcriptional regulator [Gaiellaceae bacterium]